MSEVKEILEVSLNDDVEKLVRSAEEYAKKLSQLSHTQIRKFHNHITRIWNKYFYNRNEYSKPDKFKELEEEIKFTEVFLVYQIARLGSSLRKEQEQEGKKLLEQFQEMLKKLIKSVNNQETLEKLKKFCDAFLAYHKFYSEFEKSERKGGIKDERTQQKASR